MTLNTVNCGEPAATSKPRYTGKHRRLNRIEIPVPNVYVYTNAEGKIVIPVQDEQLRINIIAAAHQEKYGHCKCKQTIQLISEVFCWHGMPK